MAYYDQLYQMQNIVGYTGDLHRHPTVYFISEELNLAGHITQAHPWPQNVGRTEPFPTDGYRMVNERKPHGTVLVEYYYNWAFHVSRNRFIALGTHARGGGADRFDVAAFAILAQSIRNCPHEKQMQGMDRTTFQSLQDAKAAKDATMAQLTQLASFGDAMSLARTKRGLT